jgi:hypothetical protein
MGHPGSAWKTPALNILDEILQLGPKLLQTVSLAGRYDHRGSHLGAFSPAFRGNLAFHQFQKPQTVDPLDAESGGVFPQEPLVGGQLFTLSGEGRIRWPGPAF